MSDHEAERVAWWIRYDCWDDRRKWPHPPGPRYEYKTIRSYRYKPLKPYEIPTQPQFAFASAWRVQP